MAKRIYYLKKYFSLYLFLLIGIVVSTSCSEDDPANPEPNPVDPEEKVTTVIDTLKFQSLEIEEFKKIQPGKAIEDLSATDSTKFFGQRIRLNCPVELHFRTDSLTDSLFIVKANELIERYKIKWEKDKLYLYNGAADTWDFCGIGNIGDKNEFALNTGFYIKQSKITQRSLNIMGQSYSVESYTSLIPESDTSSLLIWMKVKYNFE